MSRFVEDRLRRGADRYAQNSTSKVFMDDRPECVPGDVLVAALAQVEAGAATRSDVEAMRDLVLVEVREASRCHNDFFRCVDNKGPAEITDAEWHKCLQRHDACVGRSP